MGRSSLSDFETLIKLGSGSFGTVYKVRRIVDNAIYVIKDVRIGELSFREQEEAINEVNILAGIDSPYIVGYFDSFIEEGCLHIVMEYCNRGDLQGVIKRAKSKNILCLKEDVTWNLCLQVVLGLYNLHEQRILHRDLKSANIFLQKDDRQKYFSVKIGDLGVAKLLETSTAFAKTIVGTPYYLSPELVKDEPYRDKSDCWALGVLLYECCTLCHPFEARNQCALIMKIIQSPVKPPSPALVSPELSKLVLWLLQKDPMKRPNIRDILCEQYVQDKLVEHGFPLPTDIKNNPITDILTSPLSLDHVETELNNTNNSNEMKNGDNEGTEQDDNTHDLSGVATVARDANYRENNEDWETRANRIYAEELEATKNKGKTSPIDMNIDAKDTDNRSTLNKPELQRAQSGPASYNTGTGPNATKIPRMPIRTPSGANSQVRGDRVRGGSNAKRITSTRVLTRHQVIPQKSNNNTGHLTTAATAASVAHTAITAVVDANSQNKFTDDQIINLGESFKPGDFSNAMRAASIKDSEPNRMLLNVDNNVELSGITDGNNDEVLYPEDFEQFGLDRADSKEEPDHRDSQDSTFNHQIVPSSVQLGGNTNIGKPFSRINSAYSDEFEDADPSSLSRDHTTCEAKDGVIPAVGVDVVNGHGAEVADDVRYGDNGSDAKVTPRSNLSSGTSGSVHTLLSNPSSYGALAAMGAPPSVAGVVPVAPSRERRDTFDDAPYGYDDDFEDYDDELDNLYERDNADYEEDEEEEQVLSAEYLAHFGSGNNGGKDTDAANTDAEPKNSSDNDYHNDDFKESLRLSESKLDVKGAHDYGNGIDSTNAADNSDISNGAMSNDSLEDNDDDDDVDPTEVRRQIDEMLYWIADTRAILKKSLGEDAFYEIYQLCKENMSNDSPGASSGSNKASYLHEIQKKLQEHLGANLEGVLGTVMQVKALLAWEDELARRNPSGVYNGGSESINFLKEF